MKDLRVWWLYWWKYHRPIITNKEKILDQQAKICIGALDNYEHLTWIAIRPVIADLEKLRANTWDQDKITKIQNWLRDNFEHKEEKR